MILGRVIGEIHGTIKHRFYENKKLLVIEKTSPTGAPTGDYLIAADRGRRRCRRARSGAR